LIHEGFNVADLWNGGNDFAHFARRGEITSDRCEDHDISAWGP
jgi:hypothetical protein